jgi:lysozyme family protein
MSPQDPTPAFERAFQVILRLEGVGVNPKNPDGYVNHVRDPGGETKFGISKKAFPTVDLAALTRADALAIYWTHYWVPSYAEHLTWPLQVYHADAAVNQGLGRAMKFLAFTHDPGQYLAAREGAYRTLAATNPTAYFWLPAWLNRLRDLRVLAEASPALPPTV